MIKVRNVGLSKVNEVVISQAINQCEYELIGGIWTDKKGKIHYVGLALKGEGIMPDFPDMKETYVADVAQVGLKW